MPLTKAYIEQSFQKIEKAYTRISGARFKQIDANSVFAKLSMSNISYSLTDYRSNIVEYIITKDGTARPISNCQSNANIILEKESEDGMSRILFLKKEEKIFIELWENNSLVYDKEITKIIKSIYTDFTFGRVCWSSDKKEVAFIAEPKEKECNKYFVEEDSKIESAAEKFKYAQDFGERTDGKKNPTLFIYTTQTNTLEPITIVDANIYPARPIYDKEGNIYIDGILKTPVVLSPLYCSNRNSAIYKLTKCGQNWKTTLITNEYMIEGHNMSNDGSTLVYFTHDQPCVEHSICFSMKAIDILSYQKTTIVPLKNSTDKFKGIYGCSGCPSLTEDCGFLNSGDYYLLSTESLDKMTTLLINLKTNEIIDINDKFPELSCEIISYSKNYAVLRLCSNLKAPLFYFVFFEESKYSKVSLTWVPLFNSKCPLDLSLYQKTQISTKDSVGYLISPIQPKAPTPLIVALHGGPHSSFCDTYSMTFTLYLQMGYSVLYINFRGSTGYGEDYCKSLSGHVGDYDVKDCGEITKLALENKNIDKRNVFVSGGSHGGFLGCWMCVHEEYSSLFAAGCVGNPACNILGMLPATDIPDWCFATALNDSYHLPATSEEVQKMYNASPIQYVKNAKFPLAFFIGLKDKRVPPFVGKDFYHAMRLNGKKAKLYCFPEESHPIDSVEGLFVQLFDRLLWFEEHKTL